MWVNRFILLLGLGLMSDPVSACIALKQGAWDRRIKVGPQCSFDRAGEGVWGVGAGKSVENHGNGIVSQVISFGPDGCNMHEQLVVLDCKSAKVALLDGQGPKPNADGEIVIIAGASFSYVENILKPIGPLSISSSTKISGLLAMAKANDVGAANSLDRFLSSKKRKNRPDFNCGCRLFYPEMAGVN